MGVPKQILDFRGQVDRTKFTKFSTMITWRNLFILCLIGCHFSCLEYPVYKSYSTGKVALEHYDSIDSIQVVEIGLIGVQTRSGVNKVIDTLTVEHDNPFVGLDSTKFVRRIIGYDTHSSSSILRFPFKRSVPKFMNSFDTPGNKLIIFPTYEYNVEDEREGGGGISSAFKTGRQIHCVTRELYVAIYSNSQLIYSNNAMRFEQIRTIKGTPFKHEFPREIADTLLNNALKDYVQRLK